MAFTTWSTTDKALLTLTNGNLTATTTASTGAFVRGKDGKNTGKIYFESTCVTYGANSTAIAIGTATASGNNSQNACLVKTGSVIINNVNQGISLGTLLAGNVACIAVDLDAQRIWFRVGAAGNWNANAGNNPATGVGGISFSVLGSTSTNFFPMFSSGATGEAETANFGATAFTGAVPAGFASGWDDVVGGGAGGVQARAMVLA